MNMRSMSRIMTLMSFVFCIPLLFSCKKNDSGPSLHLKDASVQRETGESIMHLQVTLSKPASEPASVDYSFTDGTASGGKDFVQASGTLSIPANQSQATFDVSVIGDPQNIRQPNLDFTANLSNPVNCTIEKSSAIGTIITEDGLNLSTENTGYSTPLTRPGYTLVWSDEFSGSSLDMTSWNNEIGNGSGGWGNNELESYTNSQKNVFVTNGNLVIEARKELIGNFSYSSARLTTQGKRTFKYGRIDIRAKLPVGKGLWPALWMLGSNISSAGWPACGEIDIMELVGTYPSSVFGTMHYANLSGSHASKGSSYLLTADDFSMQFHVFSIVWVENHIQWYIDDQSYLVASDSDTGTANYPFNADQFFIFNVAVGGNWPGSPDYTTIFPQRMFVDYIRVYQ